jgi:hypothetical protein
MWFSKNYTILNAIIAGHHACCTNPMGADDGVFFFFCIQP